MRFTRGSALAVACLAGAVLGACGGFELPGKKIDYKSSGATKLPSLEVPPDLTKPTGDDRFAMPSGITYKQYEEQRGNKPESTSGATVLPGIENARVERAGSQRWLVVNGDPDKLWPVVKDF